MSTKEEFDFEKLDREINEQINTNLNELEDLEIKKKNLKNKKKLSESISQIVWEQFILQIAGNAGQDFIKKNNNLKLSLKHADHYLSEDSFVSGDLPKHNLKNSARYEKRYDDWNTLFSDKNHEHFNKDYRRTFDENRAMGNSQYSMDHTIPVAEIIRDKKAATYMDHSEKVSFANDTRVNLKPLDREANESKSDKNMNNWLNSKRYDKNHPNGATPDERFNIDREELQERDANARKEWEQKKKDAEKRAKREGRESVLDESSRAVSVTTQAVAVALFAKLTRNVFEEVFRWFAEKNRKVEELLTHLRTAITHFLTDYKNNILLSVDVGVTVLCTQIFGEIVPMIRRALLFFAIGGKTVYEVIKYLKDPKNKSKSRYEMSLDISKIATVGLTTAGGIGLGLAITAVIIHCNPALGIPIQPFFVSPASLLGIFFGGLTAGIFGAIILNLIDDALTKKQSREITIKQLNANNEVLLLQETQFEVYNEYVEEKKVNSLKNISDNIKQAASDMAKKKEKLKEEQLSENEESFNNISNMLEELKK